MGEKLHLLIVDDRGDILELLRAFLEGAGFDISTAENGAEMRRALTQAEFALAIVDIVLPRESGFTLAEELTARGVPVILMTGDFDALRRAEGLPWPVIAKPFRLTALHRLIYQVLSGAV